MSNDAYILRVPTPFPLVTSHYQISFHLFTLQPVVHLRVEFAIEHHPQVQIKDPKPLSYRVAGSFNRSKYSFATTCQV